MPCARCRAKNSSWPVLSGSRCCPSIRRRWARSPTRSGRLRVVLALPSGVARLLRGCSRRWSREPRRCAKLRPRRVFFAEWIDPPFCAGHWLPEMIELAGGQDVIGRHGQPSRSTSWEEVRGLGPKLVIIGPCGFGVEEAAAHAAGLELQCPAVAVDGDAYDPAPGLVSPPVSGNSPTCCIRKSPPIQGCRRSH